MSTSWRLHRVLRGGAVRCPPCPEWPPGASLLWGVGSPSALDLVQPPLMCMCVGGLRYPRVCLPAAWQPLGLPLSGLIF